MRMPWALYAHEILVRKNIENIYKDLSERAKLRRTTVTGLVRDVIENARSMPVGITPKLALGVLLLKAQIEVQHANPEELKDFLNFFSGIRAEIYAVL